jgi:hypothetical protein
VTCKAFIHVYSGKHVLVIPFERLYEIAVDGMEASLGIRFTIMVCRPDEGDQCADVDLEMNVHRLRSDVLLHLSMFCYSK